MTREEIEAKVWRACDIMRRDDNTKGIMKYMEQLSWLLFLKVFEAIEDQHETEARLASRAYDRILDGEWRWSSWTTKDWPGEQLINFIAERLLPHLRSLSGTQQRDAVATIFRGISVVMKSPYNLKDVITVVNEIDFHRPEDAHTISVAYEQLLSKMGSEAGLSGEFYTPRPIVRFMVNVVDSKLGETVYDPFSGSAGFLIEAHAHMRKGRRLTVDQELVLQTRTFFGQESGDLPTLLGVMNMILHGVSAPNILRRNTLEQDVRNIPPAERHDVILTNPPFGGKENQQIQQNFPVQSQSTELLALQHVMKKLKPGGRCGMVVPEGLLFRGDAFAQVKKDLLENYNLYAIVSLPSGAFTNAGIKTDLLFFERTGPTRQVWYYELLPPNGERFTKGNPVVDAHFDECLQLMRERAVTERSWISRPEDLAEHGYDLTPRNPVPKKGGDLRSPEDILAGMVEKQREIVDILGDLQRRLTNQ